MTEKKMHEPNGAIFHTDHTAERMAHELSAAAMRHCERAVNGVLAMPVAAALGVAAGALYTSAIVGRAFEIFETAVVDVGRRLGQADPHRMEPWGRDSDRLSEAQA